MYSFIICVCFFFVINMSKSCLGWWFRVLSSPNPKQTSFSFVTYFRLFHIAFIYVCIYIFLPHAWREFFVCFSLSLRSISRFNGRIKCQLLMDVLEFFELCKRWSPLNATDDVCRCLIKSLSDSNKCRLSCNSALQLCSVSCGIVIAKLMYKAGKRFPNLQIRIRIRIHFKCSCQRVCLMDRCCWLFSSVRAIVVASESQQHLTAANWPTRRISIRGEATPTHCRGSSVRAKSSRL